MKAESVPEAVELMKNGDLSNAVAVTEHGARLSRAPKQKSKRKTTIRKQLKGKEPNRQPGEKATQKPKSENRSRKPKRRTKTGRAYL